MADQTFQGVVFQIGFDANEGACTAALRNEKGTVKVTTMEGRMQGVLETAMIKSLRASITFQGTDLRSVSVSLDDSNDGL
jgi:hypothetical protein